MNVWVSAAVAGLFAIAAVGPADAGSCRKGHERTCAHLPARVNFNAVPGISEEIVKGEPVAVVRKTPADEPTGQQFYTGPTVGVSKMGRAPTVGYHWSID